MTIEKQLDGNLKRSVFKSVKDKTITFARAITIMQIAIPNYKHKTVNIVREYWRNGVMRSDNLIRSLNES